MLRKNFLLISITIALAIITSQTRCGNKITVLTDKIGGRSLGHKAVTRSLLAGLRKLNINFNHNPKSINEVGKTVIVLANVNALRQAIQLKRQGKIKKLLVGPNIMVRSDEHGSIMASKEVDICIVPSYWVQVAYEEDAPALIGRIRSWPAGVNTEYWEPLKKRNENSRNVLVYVKHKQGQSIYKPVANFLKKHNWTPIRIDYGKYNHDQFKAVLSKSKFAVFISKSESQGIALAEAWSMDVPTLVWNPGNVTIQGRKYTISSSCPYLNDQLGIDWKNLEEFEKIIKNLDEKLEIFSSRQWVLKNMSDEGCARLMLEIIESINL